MRTMSNDLASLKGRMIVFIIWSEQWDRGVNLSICALTLSWSVQACLASLRRSMISRLFGGEGIRSYYSKIVVRKYVQKSVGSSLGLNSKMF